MSTSYRKSAKREAAQTFGLYVFFHSIWTSVFDLFND